MNTAGSTLFGIAQPFLFFYLLIVVVRALLQYSDADFHNSVSRFIDYATNYPIRVVRMFTPRINGSDLLSPAGLVFIVATLEQAARFNMKFSIVDHLILGLARAIEVAGDFLVYTLLAAVVLSWIRPQKPFALVPLIFSVSNFVLAPIRRFIPPFGGLDFTPIIGMIALSIITGSIALNLRQIVAF